ncbi:MAG: ester cyclase family protein [Anaerolineales bacterium]
MNQLLERKGFLANMIWQGQARSDIHSTAPGRTLTVNEMKDAVMHLFDEANRANLDVFHELLAPEFVSYGGAGFQDLVGPEAFKQLYLQFFQGMPDLAFRVTHIVTEGDTCGVRGVLSGTHKGNFMGFAPPTGKFVCWTGTALMRFNQNGMIDARWQEWDGMSVMQQMGVVPGTPATDANLPDPPAPQSTSGEYRTPDFNKNIFQQLVDELWNKGNLDFADGVFHPQAVYVSNPDFAAGSQGLKSSVGMLRKAMPDLKTKIKTLLADGDLVLGWFSQAGTQTGALMGIPPTGKKVDWGHLIIARFAAGQIVQTWSNEGVLELMQQLGVGGSPSAGA